MYQAQALVQAHHLDAEREASLSAALALRPENTVFASALVGEVRLFWAVRLCITFDISSAQASRRDGLRKRRQEARGRLFVAEHFCTPEFLRAGTRTLFIKRLKTD